MGKYIDELNKINLDKMYNELCNNSFSLEEILKNVRKNNFIVNEFLTYIAIMHDDIDMFNMIGDAIDVMREELLIKFRESIRDNTYKSFLSNIDYRAKCNLYVMIKNFDGFTEGIPELRKYLVEIKSLIEKDEENEEIKIIKNKLNELKKETKENSFFERHGIVK